MIPDQLLVDLESKLLVVDGDRGHGKSTLVAEIIRRLYEAGWVVKVFDLSQRHYHNSPLPYRQLVKPPGVASNIGNCVYELGLLSASQARRFVAEIIEEDYRERYYHQLEDSDYVSRQPRIVYVLEEGNIYISSYSLNRKDKSAEALKRWVSVGRNYGLGGLLVCTRVAGEVSPGFRNRCNWLLGKVSGDDEARKLSGATTAEVVKRAKTLPRFKFIYYNGGVVEGVSAKPVEYGPPADYTPVEPVEHSGSGFDWWRLVAYGALAVILWLAASAWRG